MTLDALLARLDLAPHPEGGFFRETFRARRRVEASDGVQRAACTQILYALGAGQHSAWHRVRSDELWQHHAGAPLDLHLLDGRDGHRVVRLGDVREGHAPQAVVPADTWQAAVPVGEPWALLGCTVAPGFDFDDFTLASRGELLEDFPDHHEIIVALTPEGDAA